MELYNYQIENAKKMVSILKEYKICYLAAEVRTGKTLTVLTAINMLGVKRVLFITKKKAISSIESDFKKFVFSFYLKVTNFEQAKNENGNYDLVVVDESHSLGAYPKPSQRTQFIKTLVQDKYLILLSGTPSPESYSQLFHQLWISDNSPFKHKSFYKWAKEYVDVKERIINGYRINDYSRARIKLIKEEIKHLFVTFTQTEAGFNQIISEEIIKVDNDDKVQAIIDKVMEDRYYKFNDGSEIVADTPAKLMTKIHQLSSGTIKTEDGKYKVLNTKKAEYIRDNYKDKKIAVYYKFIAEKDALTTLFDNTTTDPMEFNKSNDLIFISQYQSGSMGINLSTADLIIFYNIDFSAVSYYQARERLQSKNRKDDAIVHWLFTDKGMEEKIYKAVTDKKNYTTQYFEKDYGWKASCKKSA